MGVHGLWKLIEPSGKPVPLETLENKILAVDISIWLHQAIKGFQDAKGASIPNAHLLGVYHRICKLLYFRIKPVFVFDGGVPVLKKQTIAKRAQLKSKNQTEADRIHKNLLDTLLKHTAINKVLSEKTKASISSISPPKKSKTEPKDELYYLPPSSEFEPSSSSEEEAELPSKPKWDLHSIDTKSEEFQSLPIEIRHEILTDLKETRKQSSWGRINELPTESNDFSSFQMKRLLKRQSVQQALEEAEKEMGGFSLSLMDLETLLTDQGIISNSKQVGNRIASDENTRFLYIKNIKEAIEEAKKKEDEVSKQKENNEEDFERTNKADEEYESDLKKAIEMSLQNEPSTSHCFNVSSEDSSSEEELEEIKSRFASAQSYMMEYSGLTPNEIAKIMNRKLGKINEEKVKKNEDKDETKCDEEIETEAKEKQKGKEASKNDLATNSEEIIIESDSSSSDDFVEVNEDTPKKRKENCMEIVVDPNEEVDDLFKEIFEDAEENVASEIEQTSVKKKIIETALEKVKKVEERQNKVASLEVVVEENEELDETESEDKKQIETPEKRKENCLEIVVDPNEEVDDLFKEIFEDAEENVASEVRQTSLKEKIETALEKAKKIVESQDKVSSSVVVVEDSEEEKQRETSKMIENYTEKLVKPKLSVEQMTEMKKNLDKEERELMAKKSTKERLATNITDQMYQETQELLELFGVPYVIAPMEAEAQCAFLDEIELTDGTITDDSDIWLFGGRTVYKNFFNHSKHVLEFKSENIKTHFKLTREQMILLALLVGSDYTTGLMGVGPVTALEVLAAFPPKLPDTISGLREFRTWLVKGKTAGPGRTGLKSKLKNVTISENFPNLQVVQAYLEPKIDGNRDKFTWTTPDLAGLTEFARIKFGWTKVKTEEILNPVLKRMEERKSQTFIRDYFKSQSKTAGNVEEQMSKRVRTAVKRIGNEALDEKEKPIKKQRVVSRKRKQQTEEEMLEETQQRSEDRMAEIQKEMDTFVEKMKKPKILPDLHKREVIPQKQKEKTDMLKSKLRAIEVFRKSKKGPGYVPKKKRPQREVKEDAGLSESSDE